MRLADLKIYTKTYNGDTREFFDINSRYSGYLSRDRSIYFVLDNVSNSYKDYSASELDAFLQNLSSGITETVTDFTQAPANFFSNIMQTDGGKVSTGLLLLGALVIGIFIINKY